MSLRIVLLLLALSLPFTLWAQEAEKPAEPAPPAATKPSPNPVQRVVDDQFGDGFKLDPAYKPLAADFDGDGTEDLALVVVSKKPMANSQEKNYKVVDPYDSYFGYGDPKVTTKFADFGDGSARCVAVMHDWRGGTPKMKFVIVNLPFQQLELGKMPLKKKTVAALSTTEYGGLSALVYWDGKKYKWEPNELGKDASDMKQ
jgi:hypothetical protein